jgi:hypothetical protein
MWYRLFVPTPQVNSVPGFWSIDLQNKQLESISELLDFTPRAHFEDSFSFHSYCRMTRRDTRRDYEFTLEVPIVGGQRTFSSRRGQAMECHANLLISSYLRCRYTG